jgi:hypothetical protein
MEKEDCKFCKYKIKNDNSDFCFMFKKYPGFKFPQECGYFSEYKVYNFNMIYFEKL